MYMSSPKTRHPGGPADEVPEEGPGGLSGEGEGCAAEGDSRACARREAARRPRSQVQRDGGGSIAGTQELETANQKIRDPGDAAIGDQAAKEELEVRERELRT